MQALQNTYRRFSRVMCFLMAMHIFNLSVDPRDPHQNFKHEDLSLNDIESITEFVAEVVFDCANAFVEHDEADNDGGSVVDLCKVICPTGSAHLLISSIATERTINYFIFGPGNYALPIHEISSPPPKA